MTKQKEIAPAARPVLLDTSALMALIEDEAGADRVEKALRQEKIILPWPVLFEAYYLTFQGEGEAEADARYALIKQLRAEFLWDMDEAITLTAAGLKARFRLSFADATIAAFALSTGATLMHKDPEYETLAGEIPQEILPYK